MKKFFTILMATLMIFSMTSCSLFSRVKSATKDKQTAVDGSASTVVTSPEEETTSEALDFGSINGATYENKALGIGFKADDGWTFKTKDELAQLAGLTSDFLDDDVAKALKDASVVYDMMAISADQMTNVVVTFENIGAINGVLLDIDAYIDAAISQLETQLSSTGAEIISCEKTTFTIDGKEFKGIKNHMKMSGVDTYQSMIFIKIGDYIGAANATSILTDTSDQLLNKFYIL